jgi:DNA-binding response OmpR family regulator
MPIVILSGRGERRIRVRGLELGADDFVNKPFDVDELLARIRAQLRVRQAEEARSAAEKAAARLQAVHDLGVSISHELNQPLSVLRGCLEFLEDEELDRREIRRFHASMQEAVDQLVAKVHRFQALQDYVLKDYDADLAIIDLERSAELGPGPKEG